MIVTAGFMAFLVASFAVDVRRRRLPNDLTMIGLFCGMVAHAFADGWKGAAFAAVGAAAGLALTLPLWLLHAVGAGDVKWFCAAGAWLGAQSAATLIACSLGVAGAIGGICLFRSAPFRERLRGAAWSVWFACRTGSRIERLFPLDKGIRFPFMAAVLPGACAIIVWQWRFGTVGAWP